MEIKSFKRNLSISLPYHKNANNKFLTKLTSSYFYSSLKSKTSCTYYLSSQQRGCWCERWNCIDFWKDCSNSIQLGEREGRTKEGKNKKVSSAQSFAHYSAFLILCQDFTTIPYIVFMMKALLIQMEGGMFSLPKLKLSLEFKPSLGVTPISHWIYNCKGKLYILH